MKKTLILFVIIAFVFGFGIFSEARAGSEQNVSGWAWSEYIGWISFNDTAGGGGIDYGVNIAGHTDPDPGNLTGYAWSRGTAVAKGGVGWIDFNPVVPGYFTPNHSARIDLITGKVSGWARVVEHGNGWDGWIKMRCHGAECAASNYGVYLYTGTTPNELRGWAWGGDTVVGWISFNCADQGICLESNYKVTTTFDINAPPNQPGINPEYPEGEVWNHCAWGTTPLVAFGTAITFHWTYFDPEGDIQTNFEIQVDDNTAFTVPKFNHSVMSDHTSYTLDLGHDTDADWLSELAWETNYWWRVRVRDGYNWSEWSLPNKFRTANHASPEPSFTFTPSHIVAGQEITFNAGESVCFGLGGVTTTCASWFWAFSDGATSTGVTTTHTFTVVEDPPAILTVTDGSDFSCSISTPMTLPPLEWIEIPAVWLERILARITNVFDNLF